VSYNPPDCARIEAAFAAGSKDVQVVVAGRGRYRIVFKAGHPGHADQLALDAGNFRRNVQRLPPVVLPGVPDPYLLPPVLARWEHPFTVGMESTTPKFHPGDIHRDWWFDFDATQASANAGNAVVVWKVGGRNHSHDRRAQAPSPGEIAIWEAKSSSGSWFSPITNKDPYPHLAGSAPTAGCLATIEGEYLAGRAHTTLRNMFPKKTPFDNHRYMIDFETMTEYDIYFPMDTRRRRKVRRRLMRVPGFSSV